MRTNKSKKGISLIVLVITIIVMIILAAAIILSISNSGIMKKANKAKTESDAANLKEYVNVLKAEWDLMDSGEKTATGFSSTVDYVNNELDSKGYTQALLMEDGTLYTNLQANTKKVLKAGIKVGDPVDEYTLSSKSIDVNKNINTAPNGTEIDTSTLATQSLSNKPNSDWVFMGISDNGEIQITTDMDGIVPTVKISGQGGYVNGPAELDRLCGELYTTSIGTARSINIDDVNKILEYKGAQGSYYSDIESKTVYTPDKILTIGDIISLKKEPELTHTVSPIKNKDVTAYEANYYSISNGSDEITKDTNRKNLVFQNNKYWIASSCVSVSFNIGYAHFNIFCANNTDVGAFSVTNSEGKGTASDLCVRPVVTIKSDVSVNYENNTLYLS